MRATAVIILSFFFLQLTGIEAGVITNSVKDEPSNENRSLLDHQIPNDIVFDLVGRKTLITQDEETEEYNTFKVYDDEGIPFVVDPWSSRKYVVKYSVTSRDIDIFPVTMMRGKGRGGGRRPVIMDWSTDTINSVTLNKYGEVELVPIERKATRQLLGTASIYTNII